MGFLRPTFAEIDLAALEYNFNVAKSSIPAKVGIMAMVKADAYGHGVIPISKRLEKCGVDAFGVATIEEGLELRDAKIDLPIIVMGGLMGMGSSACGVMVDTDLTPVVHSIEVLNFLESVSKAADKVIGIHLKIDTGMSRLGAMPDQLDKLLAMLKECKNIRLDGVMTHLAEAENKEYTSHQIDIFDAAAQKISTIFNGVKVWHIANSAATIDGGHIVTKKDAASWVRPGLMLYGAYPTKDYKKRVELKPVMSIKSSVVLMKTVPVGTKVSYSCTYTTTRKTRLAVIPIGYADGYPWTLSNKGSVLINQVKVPVVGRVTMDMLIVDVTDINVHIGDEVVLLGRQGKKEITVNEFAELAGTITYEVFTRISKRMPRIYVN